jgi:hypothetical protein
MLFLITYKYVFFEIWGAMLAARFFGNMYAYGKTDPKAIEVAPFPFAQHFESNILLLFTFKIDLDEEYNTKLARIIRGLNILHLIFIFYSVFTFILLLLTYGKSI